MNTGRLLELSASSQAGPMNEGLLSHDIESLNAAEAKKVVVTLDDGEQIEWPLLVPIEYCSEFQQEYIQDKYGSLENVYYLWDIPDNARIFDQKEADDIFLDLIKEKSTIISERLSSAEHKLEKVAGYLRDTGILVEVVELDIEHDSDLSPEVVHYAGQIVPTRVYESEPTRDKTLGTRLIDYYKKTGGITVDGGETVIINAEHNFGVSSVATEEIKEKLWEIYSGQFVDLVQHHPSRQLQTKEELMGMMEDPENIVVVHKEDGEIVAFAVFVANINNCDWLNLDFFKESFDNPENLLYFPGIASDASKSGNHYSQNIINLIAKILDESNSDPMVVFQCTEVSKQYIPELVEASVESTGRFTIDISEYAKYLYHSSTVK